MRSRLWWAWTLGAVLTACGPSWVIPVVPPAPPPPAPGPGPTPAVGAISEAQYAAVSEGMTEAQAVAALGPPFRTSETGGYRVLVWAFADKDSVAWVFIRDGVVERKARL